LTVVLHELGHELGLDHDDADVAQFAFMTDVLDPGVRLLPTSDAGDAGGFDAVGVPNNLVGRFFNAAGDDVRYVPRPWSVDASLREMLFFDEGRGDFSLKNTLTQRIMESFAAIPSLDGWLMARGSGDVDEDDGDEEARDRKLIRWRD
jgi:hypothetical protein